MGYWKTQQKIKINLIKIDLYFLFKLGTLIQHTSDFDFIQIQKNKVNSKLPYLYKPTVSFLIFYIPLYKSVELQQLFLKKLFKYKKNLTFYFNRSKLMKIFFFVNRFLLLFLEDFFKYKILFNFKKGTNRLVLKYVSYRKFTNKYFKKNLNVRKQILGVLYYSFLLKDASIFSNFFKKVLEKASIKNHKKLFLGLKKLIIDLYRPIFNFLGLLGLFFNIRGKIGVSGNAKKRRYFFYVGKHSLTTRQIKVDFKFTPIWTYTGVLGFGFYLFF